MTARYFIVARTTRDGLDWARRNGIAGRSQIVLAGDHDGWLRGYRTSSADTLVLLPGCDVNPRFAEIMADIDYIISTSPEEPSVRDLREALPDFTDPAAIERWLAS